MVHVMLGFFMIVDGIVDFIAVELQLCKYYYASISGNELYNAVG